MKRILFLMLALVLTLPQVGITQVGKRTKFSGKKAVGQFVADTIIQIGNLRLTHADAQAFKGERVKDFINMIPNDQKMTYVIGKLDGMDKAFQNTFAEKYPDVSVLEYGKTNVVLVASPTDARTLPIFEGVDIVEVLTAEQKLSGDLRNLITLKNKPDRLDNEEPNTLRPLEIIPHGQVPVFNEAGIDELASEKIDVTFYLFQGQAIQNVEDLISAASGRVSSSGTDGTISVIRATVPIDAVETIAESHSIREVTSDSEFIKHNDLALQVLVRNPPAYVLPIEGTGQIVGHSDSGLDVGQNDNSIHEAFRGRVKKTFALGRPNSEDWSDRGGHGTHTAGSILGAGRFPGVAPKAVLVHQSLDDDFGRLTGIPSPLSSLFQDAYLEGARVHSNSWGVSAFDQSGINAYGGWYLRGVEVDSWSWNNGNPKDMLIVFSAGNDGRSFTQMTVTSPGTAKNCLTVGACETFRPIAGVDGDSINDLASFSSLGPTRGGRLKPDLVAPGTWIASAKTQASQSKWSDNLDSATIGNAIQDWRVTPGFVLVDNPEGNGNKAFQLKRTVGSRFQDVLQSPKIDFPAGHGLSVEIWVQGNVAGLASLRFGFVTGAGLSVFPNQARREFDRWTLLSFQVPREVQGTSARFAIVAQEADGLTNDIELYFDDPTVTTFGSWGAMSSFELAQPNDETDKTYTLSGGTSMATPLVAGCAVLVRQSLVDSGIVNPSAELVKGILINTADPHQGGRPNIQSGWGLVNLRRAIETDFTLDHESSLSASANEITYEIDVPGEAAELRATLVWADAPGDNLVNDLDLVLKSPLASVITSADQTGIKPDRKNNVEGIDLNLPEEGKWEISVSAHRISQGSSQPFALVVSILK
jgi:subtilisin family serine protease